MQTFVVLGVVLAEVALATTIIITPQQSLIDHASSAAKRGEHRQASLDLMRAIAEGKSKEAVLAAADESGLRSYVQDQYGFDSTRTRCYAFERIGSTDLPEAEAYLNAITKETIVTDDGQKIFMAARLAGQKLLFRRETDPRLQILFLEDRASRGPDPLTVLWAADELCNRGSIGSFTIVKYLYEGLWSGSYGEQLAENCRTRMDIVNGNPNRATALGSVLVASAPLQQESILRWAVIQLVELDSPQANEILDRYAAEVKTAYPDIPRQTLSPQEAMHLSVSHSIWLGRAFRRPSSAEGEPDVPARR
jgi:hypothetical protein